MSEIELKKWFIDKFHSCYAVKYDNDIHNYMYLFYDEKLIRKSKLCKLNNTEFRIDKISGKCIFGIDFFHQELWFDYYEIYSFFEKNNINDYDDIVLYIKDIIKNNLSIKTFLPLLSCTSLSNISKRSSKYKIVSLHIKDSINLKFEIK